jgi:ABC-type multidrug transport system fused ATPase/permease subunit
MIYCSVTINTDLQHCSIGCMPIFLIPLGIASRKQTTVIADLSLRLSRCSKLAEQAFSAIRTVHAFSLSHRFAELLKTQYQNMERSQSTKDKLTGFSTGYFLGVMFAIFGLTFWYGSKLVISSDMEGSNVVVTLFCMMLAMLSLMSLPPALAIHNEAKGAAVMLFQLIDSNQPKKARTHDKLELQGNIKFENVHFAYPSRTSVPVLIDFSLDIEQGQTVAFVGQSGSGKSTIVALLQLFYVAQRGKISIDGVPIGEYDIHNLRQTISVVGSVIPFTVINI